MEGREHMWGMALRQAAARSWKLCKHDGSSIVSLVVYTSRFGGVGEEIEQ